MTINNGKYFFCIVLYLIFIYIFTLILFLFLFLKVKKPYFVCEIVFIKIKQTPPKILM